MRRGALAGGLPLIALAACGLIAALSAPPESPASDTEHAWQAWEADLRSGRVPLKPWTEPQVESIAQGLADANLRAVAEIDSLYCMGAFGPPGSERGRTSAHRAFKQRAIGPFDYIAKLATDSCVRQSEERELRRPFGESFVNMGAFPFDALARVWIGDGRFRIDYDLREGFRTTAEMMVGVPSTICTERVRLAGEDRLMLRMAYPAGLHGKLELLFDSTYRGVVERRTVIDRGDTLELVIVRDLEGIYVRKWGVHRIGGLATWRSRAAIGRNRDAPPTAGADPESVRVGAAAYFPRIELRLPWFLPDLGLNDLREFHVPRPIWERRYVSQDGSHPAWLGLDPTGAMTEWEGEGPRPLVLDEIFPDQ